MSPSVFRFRLVLVLALSALWVLLPAEGALASGAPPQCFASVFGATPDLDGRYPVEAGDVSQGSIGCTDPENDNRTFSVQALPEHGTLSLSENPPSGTFESASFTYTSQAAYRGPDQFTLRTSDGTNMVDTVVKVNVIAPANDAPQCFASISGGPSDPDGRFPVEDGDAAAGSISCSDDEGTDLTFSVPTGPAHGTLTPLLEQPQFPGSPSQLATFTYTPTAGYRGPDEFTLRASDGTNNADRVVKVNVIAPVNNPPACFASLSGGLPGQDGRIPVEDGDTAPGSISCSDDEGTDLTFSVPTGPAHGTLTPLQEQPQFPGSTSQSATFTYTPTAGYRGPDEFTLRASDGTHNVDKVVKVTVIESSNNPPACSASLTGVSPGIEGRFPAEAGDAAQGSIGCSDDEGDNRTFSVMAGPEHGTLSPLSESPPSGTFEFATFTYTPAAAYRGPDQFTVRTSDGTNTVDTVVRVNVIAPVNDAPQCFASLSGQAPGPGGRYQVEAGVPEFGSMSCTDDEQADLTFSILQQPANGTVSSLQEQSFPGSSSQFATFTYTPALGDDEFKLRVSDGTNNVDRAFLVNVGEPVNEEPQCSLPNPIQVEQGETLRFDAETACFDPEDEPLTLAITDQPDHGAITGPDEDGIFTYTAPAAPFTGTDAFGVEVSDGVNTIARTVNIQVIPFANDPPECFDDFVQVHQPSSARVFPDCFDDERQALTYTVTQQPEHGTLTGDPANGGWTYTPAPGFTGTDSFSYKADDGENESDVAIVELTVGLDNVPPNTFITGGPTGTTPDSTPDFAFFSSETGSSFECRVDAGAFVPCSSPHTTATLANGQHTFEVRAKDPAGNTDASPASRTFTVAAGDGGGGTGGGEGGGGGGAPGGGSAAPKPPCAGLTGPSLAQCKLNQQIEKKCGKLSGKKKALCAKRERAVAKCNSLKAKSKKQKAKKQSCLRKAKQIGKKKS